MLNSLLHASVRSISPLWCPSSVFRISRLRLAATSSSAAQLGGRPRRRAYATWSDDDDRKEGVDYRKEEGLKRMFEGAERIRPRKTWLIGLDNVRETLFSYHKLLWEFRSEEDLQEFNINTDAAIEGKSEALWEISPHGKALFHGTLNSEIPAGRNELEYMGYCLARSKPFLGAMNRVEYLDLSGFNVLNLRVRGDGRTYMIHLSVSEDFQESKDTLFCYPLYTRGGPYWQDVSIPFSKFYMTYHGRMQDFQCPVDLQEFESLGLMIADGYTGPFSLEIDFIGVSNDPTIIGDGTSDYELYNAGPDTGRM